MSQSLAIIETPNHSTEEQTSSSLFSQAVDYDVESVENLQDSHCPNCRMEEKVRNMERKLESLSK